MSDYERIMAAFTKLREAGYAAEGNFLCCGTCASRELESEWGDRFVYWHAQDDEMAFGRTIEWVDVDPSEFDAPPDADLPDKMPLYGEERLSEDLFEDGLWLGYGSVETGERACEALRAEGLRVEWSGDYSERIHVFGAGEPVPRPA